MNILVIGAGAIGSLVGAKLARVGHNVTLVGRPRFAAVVSDRGLMLQDESGRHQVTEITPATSIETALSSVESYDFAVLAVKSYDTAAAIQEVSETVADNISSPTIVSLQNGVGNEECISKTLGPASVIAGTITTPVSALGPAQIQVEKPDYTVGLSQWHPAVSSTAFDAAQSALSEAGFTVTLYSDAQGLKWTKLLMNMVGNASCAILDMTPAQIFANRNLANLEIASWREAISVMKKAGIPPTNIGSYPFGLLAPLIRTLPLPILRRSLRKSVGEARGGKMPSLYIDLDSGRKRSEVSWLNGATVRKGYEMDVPTPVNRMLTDVLLRLVEDPTERRNWRRNPDRLIAMAAEYQSAESASEV